MNGFNNFRLGQPLFGWMLLLALPLLAAFFFWSWRVRQKLIARFVQARLLSTLTVGVSPARQKFRLVLLGLAVAGVLFALAGPQWGFAWEEATQHGLDIIVAVDTSRSMLAADVVPNRLEKAKLAAYDLMRLAKDDRLGLIAFAGSAFLQCPLTLDDEAFRQSVAALNVGIIPQGGTALSEAIRTAQASFEKGNNNHKVLILFTDGEDHDADAETLGAAKEAAEAGLKIFTVGVGTAAGELLRVADDQGNMGFVKDEDGNVVKSHLNEALLQQIATAAGGFYLPLIGADPMEILYNRGLAPLPKSESTTKLTRVYHERYHWFLGFAVLCLVAEILLPERPRARSAVPNPNLPNQRLGKAAAIGCLLLLLPAVVSASTPGAFDKYQSGDYQGAFDEYNRLAQMKTNDYRLHYNAGTAAYRAKELDAAEKQLEAALNSPEIANDLDTQEHAYFNLGNTLYRQGDEPEDDSKKKQERWEGAVTNFSRALQLNTNDADAKSNLAFVRKKLEQLKQQQQQQKSQDQKNQDNQNQDQNKQQDQQQKNQDQKNQDQKNQQNQNQNQQQKSAQQNQPNQKDKSDQSQSQAQKDEQNKQKREQAKQQQAQQDKDKQGQSAEAKPGGEDQRDKSPDQNKQGTAMVAAQMTRQQAQQMLDAQKDDEKALIFAPDNPPNKTITGKFKDW